MAVPEIVRNRDRCTLNLYKLQRVDFYFVLFVTVYIGAYIAGHLNTWLPSAIPFTTGDFMQNPWIAALTEETLARVLPGLAIPLVFSWLHRNKTICFNIKEAALVGGLLGGFIFGFLEFYFRLTGGVYIPGQLTFHTDWLAPFLVLHPLNGLIVLGGTLRATGDFNYGFRDWVTIFSLLAIGVAIHWVWNTWWLEQSWFWKTWNSAWMDVFQFMGINI